MPPQSILIDDHSPLSAAAPPAGHATGLIPRDFRANPPGSLYYAKPFNLKLIPRNEWADRIAARKAAKAQLTDVRNTGMFGQPIPSRDQDGKGYCHTADTEVLTEKGWVAYPEYDWNTPIATVNPLTHAMEFQRPFEKHVYEYDGEMIYSSNRRLDFGVTPDHEMYVRKWDPRRGTLSSHYSFVRATDLGWYCGLLHAPSGQIGTEIVEVEVPGDRRYDGDDFLSLLSLIISDGFAGGSENTRNLVSFASFRDELRPAVSALAARLGFKEAPSRPGVWNRWNAGALAAWLRENCYVGNMTGARAKCIPLLVKCVSQRQIKHFLHWYGDRSYSGQKYFWSTSKRLIDDLQELHLRIGKRSSISSRNAKDVHCDLNSKGIIKSGSCYVLCVADTDRLCLERKKHIETDRYKGLVYCAAVPNHTLLTRRNGSVLISSNCWAHSGVSAHLAARAFMNEPYVDLSAFAVAAMIKNFRDEGGWGGEGVEFQASKGCPTSQYWPQQSMDRANDNPNTWVNAALHKYVQWMDLDPDSMLDQLVTALLSDCPVVSDYTWWSHSVCSMDADEWDGSTLTNTIWNSWGNYPGSDNGTVKLKGRKAIPDSAIAAVVVSPSQA